MSDPTIQVQVVKEHFELLTWLGEHGADTAVAFFTGLLAWVTYLLAKETRKATGFSVESEKIKYQRKRDGAIRQYRNELHSLLSYLKNINTQRFHGNKMTLDEINKIIPNESKNNLDPVKIHQIKNNISNAFHTIDSEFLTDDEFETSNLFIKQLQNEILRYSNVGVPQQGIITPGNVTELILKAKEAPTVINNILNLIGPVIKSIGTPKLQQFIQDWQVTG